MIAMWSAKGGSGTSVTLALVALSLHRRGRRPLVVDLGGDQAAITGADAPAGPGFGDWLSAAAAGPAALARISHDAGHFDLVGAGRLGSVDDAARVEGLDDDCLLDAGVVRSGSDPVARVIAASRSLLVIRPCYLAVRRAAALSVRIDGLVVLNEPGRSLSAADIADVLQAPVLAEIDLDPAVARAVDAGRLGHKSFKVPRAVERLVRRLSNEGADRAA